jgi:hypothetical protein
LVIDPGAVIIGSIRGGGGHTVVELASGTSAGTITGLYHKYRYIGTIEVDTGANWWLDGTDNTILQTFVDLGSFAVDHGSALINDGKIELQDGTLVDDGTLTGDGQIQLKSGSAFEISGDASGNTIAFQDATDTIAIGDPAGVTLTLSGFALGDEIDLASIAYNSGHMRADGANGQIYVLDSGTQVADLHLSGVSGVLAVGDDGHGHAEISVVCFAAGTRISTASGTVEIERLAPGDRVRTVSGSLEPVRWIGHRRLDAARHRRPDKAYPVRIRRGALADCLPHRDLLVSPAHALLIDGLLVPAELIVNGATILHDRSRRVIDYYHIELDRHDAVLAEGVAAETYLDCGNRGFFDDGSGPVSIYASPDGDPSATALTTRGPALVAIRQRLSRRLGALGYRIAAEPRLRLLADGASVGPISVERDRYRFTIADRAAELRLVSAAGALAWTRADSFDARRLGVPVLAMQVLAEGSRHAVDLADGRLFIDGWHQLDGKDQRRWRWTNGDARLPIDGPGMIEITIGSPVSRWSPPDVGASLSA